MITGSHNPPEYNGFKICLGVHTIHGSAVKELHTLIETNDFETGQEESGKRMFEKIIFRQ